MRVMIAGLFAAAVGAGATAGTNPDPDPSPNPKPLETMLVTGAYSPRPALTASLSVLERAQIRALNKRTLADLLQTLPGILVEEPAGPGGPAAVSIRGGDANFTLVLLDGVPVNDPTNSRGGSYDFAGLGADAIERIEVVRGAQSAVYGSDALAGVINIITRRPVDGHSQELRGEWGESGYRNLGLNAMGVLGALDYSLDLSGRDTGDTEAGGSRDFDHGRLRLGWEVSPDLRLAGGYSVLDGERSAYPEQSGGPEYARDDALDRAGYRDTVWSLSGEVALSPGWRTVLRGSRFEHAEKLASPGIPPYTAVPPNGSDTEYRRDTLQWLNSLQAADGMQVDFGADYRSEEGESVGYLDLGGFELPTDFTLQRDTLGLFAELSLATGKGLLLQGSLRYDDADDFDGESSLRLGGSWQLAGAVVLSANWGEAYKLPSFFALGHGLVGNPALEPERATSWDLGLDWSPAGSVRVRATLFDNEYRDLIDFDPERFTNVNRRKVDTRGGELQISWQPRERLALSGQATYTDIEVAGDAAPLTGRPRWIAGMSADYRLGSAWQAMLDYRYTGEQYAASLHTGASVTETLEDYHRLDAVLRWQLRAFLQLQLSLDNLTDSHYHTAVGFPGPGRSLRLGVRLARR